MAWNPEDKLLLYCCKKVAVHDAQDNLDGILRRVDWDIFLEKARIEGISAFVFHRLSDIARTHKVVPGHITRELQKDYYAVACRNAIMLEESGRVLKALEKAGLSVMVLKGAALCETVYGNPALRPMSDVDLLIRKDDLGAVDRTLGKTGYFSSGIKAIDLPAVPVDYLASVIYRSSSQDSMCFHVHWHFVNSTIPNNALISNIDINHIWDDAVKANIAGTQALVMAPHHLLIHLAEHALRVRHSLSKFSFLCDISQTVDSYGDDINWDRFITEAKRFRLRRFIYLPLYFAGLLLDANIPEEIIRELRPKKFTWLEKIFAQLMARNHRLAGLSYLLHLSINEGVCEKLRFILRTLFPARSTVAQRCGIYQRRIGSVFYLRRMLEVLLAFAMAAMSIARMKPGFHPRGI